MNYNFLIIGGDTRLSILGKELTKDGNKVKTFANKIEGLEEIDTIEDISKINYDIVISSIPLTKDGENVHTPLSDKKVKIEDLKNISKNKILISGKLDDKIEGYDILKDESQTILNTIPTAEGAIQLAMQETTCILQKCKVMVLGFGNVGKTLCNKLKAINTDVYCSARKEKDLAWIEAYGYNAIKFSDIDKYICKMDIIFNTIPAKVLDKNKLILINKETLIIDLASYPGGVDFEIAKKMGIKAKLELGIPGKVAPSTSAKYIKEYIYKIIKSK